MRNRPRPGITAVQLLQDREDRAKYIKTILDAQEEPLPYTSGTRRYEKERLDTMSTAYLKNLSDVMDEKRKNAAKNTAD